MTVRASLGTTCTGFSQGDLQKCERIMADAGSGTQYMAIGSVLYTIIHAYYML